MRFLGALQVQKAHGAFWEICGSTDTVLEGESMRLLCFSGFLFLSLFFSLSTHAIIFGQDNRREVVVDAFKNRTLAPAIAMSVGSPYIQTQPEGFFDLDFLLATDSLTLGLCPEERFSRQYANWINCTGFLVAPDILVTAGHCMTFQHSERRPRIAENEVTAMCADFDWMFDFKTDVKGMASITGYQSSTQHSACKEVLYSEISQDILRRNDLFVGEYGMDLAIIRLAQPMPQRPLLKLSKTDSHVGESLFTIGYPSGLPMKLATHARVLDNHFRHFFTADLDISGGNSGGPVFNSKNEVVGIVVRASPGEDYIWDEKRSCSTSFVCKKRGEGDCAPVRTNYPLGVHVQKIAPIREKLHQLGIL